MVFGDALPLVTDLSAVVGSYADVCEVVPRGKAFELWFPCKVSNEDDFVDRHSVLHVIVAFVHTL